MIRLFTQPIELLTQADVSSVLGWPESLTVEFKKELSGKDGRPNPWVGGGKLDDHGRDKLFKEAVAFANTSGGHLILGVEETKDAPPIAAGITPVPRCIDLAERLARAAQSIDPPIPRLLVHGIETAGDAGVVVFRVPSSRSAPHRALDKECYVRRGTNSVPMGMREIQDMTLAAGRREERVDARFAREAAAFAAWFSTPLEGGMRHAGFRITAVPVGWPFELGRLYGSTSWTHLRQNYTVTVGGKTHTAHALRMAQSITPIVRGIRLADNERLNRSYFDVYSDGTVATGFRITPYNNKLILTVGWFVAHTVNVLKAIHSLRELAEVPDCEYGIEFEICSTNADEPVLFQDWPGYFEVSVGSGFRSLPLTLPRLSFGSIAEVDRFVSLLVDDLFDAVAARHVDPVDLRITI